MTYHRKLTALSVLLAAVALATLFSAGANADPFADQVLKFQQQPMIGTQVGVDVNGIAQLFDGHDELSTASLSTKQLPGPMPHRNLAARDRLAVCRS